MFKLTIKEICYKLVVTIHTSCNEANFKLLCCLLSKGQKGDEGMKGNEGTIGPMGRTGDRGIKG